MNPIFADLGIVQIRWYSVMIFFAMLIGGWLLLREAKKYKVNEDDLIDMLFWLLPIGLLGARLYYVLFNWNYYSNNMGEILQIWNGGLAIHGGILFGLIYVVAYSKKHNMSTIRLLDMGSMSLILGQAIGRWGNFFNQEAHGGATTLEFLQTLHLPQFIIDGMNIGGVYYHPTFLYESLWCIIGFIIMRIIKHRKYLKLGTITSFYFIWYGLGRFFIESLRTDSLMFGSLKQAQIVSILMIVFGVLMYFWANRGGIFERLYNTDKNVNYDDLPDQKKITKEEILKMQLDEVAEYAKHGKTSLPSKEVEEKTIIVDENGRKIKVDKTIHAPVNMQAEIKKEAEAPKEVNVWTGEVIKKEDEPVLPQKDEKEKDLGNLKW